VQDWLIEHHNGKKACKSVHFVFGLACTVIVLDIADFAYEEMAANSDIN
jgi:hypothetical protein